MNVSQPLVASLASEAQLTKVEPEEMKDRRVQIGNVAPIGDGMVAEVVRSAIRLAAGNAAAREPD
jgi:hypothetical protein